MKEIRVIYIENGKVKESHGIEYDDFDVNKDFTTFYSKKKEKMQKRTL